MSGWRRIAQALGAAPGRQVLVSVARARGSTPREAGARMLVGEDGVRGTVGGGALEYDAVRVARAMLAQARAGDTRPRLEAYPLGPRLGQCCGGHVTLHFEVLSGGEIPAWLAAAAAHEAQATPGVLVTPLAASAPGGRLAVSADETRGSLGTTWLDARAVALAKALLGEPSAPVVRRVTGASGEMELLLEPLGTPDFPVVLFGAGHVGKALVGVLAELPCAVAWVDSRAGEFPAGVPQNVRAEPRAAPGEAVDTAPAGAYFLVMTHSHRLDLMLCERILRRGDFEYLGLIGSDAKRRRFEKRLGERGIPAERLARLTCPIGVAGIDAKHPGAIAVAVAAQVLQVREPAAACAENESVPDHQPRLA